MLTMTNLDFFKDNERNSGGTATNTTVVVPQRTHQWWYRNERNSGGTATNATLVVPQRTQQWWYRN